MPDDGGAAPLAHDLDVEALGPQQGGRGLGARLDVGLVEGVEADAGDAGERLEVGAQGRHQGGDPVAEGGDLVGGQHVGHVADPTDGCGRRRDARARHPRPSTYSGGVFGRSKTTNDELVDDLHPQRDGAKNRPTPKRKDQEAARKQPLVVADRKQAKQIDKARRNEQLAKTRQAMITGDDAGLPARDKGPVRRYMRDYIDARRNLAEFMLPVMLIVLALSFMRTSTILFFVTILTYSVLLTAVADTFLMYRGLKKRLAAKFGDDAAATKGNGMYAAMRAFQMRRSRMPRPQVKRGEYPS